MQKTNQNTCGMMSKLWFLLGPWYKYYEPKNLNRPQYLGYPQRHCAPHDVPKPALALTTPAPWGGDG